MNMLTTLVLVLVFCFVLNVPVGFSLGIASAATLLVSGSQMTVVPQQMVAGVNSFPLLAIPFFMMAGTVMDRGGVSKRVVAFADVLVGHIRGGLAAVSIIACAFFAALSGSTPATAAAIGSLTIPEMEKRGYSSDYASAVVASASCLGVIIPPSIPMVLFGVTAGVSVGKLLLGGVIPGIFLALLLIVMNFIMAKKYNYPTGVRKGLREIVTAFKDAVWALIMPIIIMGGIMTGIFTPTESACVAVVYGLIIGFFVYRELKLADLIELSYKAALGSAMIMLLIACAKPFGWLLTSQQVPTMISRSVLSLTDNATMLYILVLVLYLFLGCLMETSAIILLTVPILLPIMQSIGADMIHFGVLCVIDLAIGMMTPPVGVALFTTAGISNTSLSGIISKIGPFLLISIVGLFILAFIPQITTFLPNLLMD